METKIIPHGFSEEKSNEIKEEGERLAQNGCSPYAIAMHIANKYGGSTNTIRRGDNMIIDCYSPTYF